jgi:hypothetical protein
MEALGFSVHNSNQVMEVPGFLPDYQSRGEIKNSREREVRDNFFLAFIQRVQGYIYRSSAPCYWRQPFTTSWLITSLISSASLNCLNDSGPFSRLSLLGLFQLPGHARPWGLHWLLLVSEAGGCTVGPT